jgi:hypothetical protein
VGARGSLGTDIYLYDACQAKAMTAFLSGEMKDTVEMNPAGTYGEYCSQHIQFST